MSEVTIITTEQLSVEVKIEQLAAAEPAPNIAAPAVCRARRGDAAGPVPPRCDRCEG